MQMKLRETGDIYQQNRYFIKKIWMLQRQAISYPPADSELTPCLTKRDNESLWLQKSRQRRSRQQTGAKFLYERLQNAAPEDSVAQGGFKFRQ